MSLIDSGSAKAVPGVVRSALALPPPVVIDPGAVIGAPPAGAPTGAAPQPQANGPQ